MGQLELKQLVMNIDNIALETSVGNVSRPMIHSGGGLHYPLKVIRIEITKIKDVALTCMNPLAHKVPQ